MKATAAGPEGVFTAGQVVEVNGDLGKAFVDGGYAAEEKAKVVASQPVPKKKANKKRKAAQKPPETATMPEPEGTEAS